ncbi:MAG: hypothetical protein U0N08_09555 [Oscillospiraceae bacterium]
MEPAVTPRKSAPSAQRFCCADGALYAVFPFFSANPKQRFGFERKNEEADKVN